MMHNKHSTFQSIAIACKRDYGWPLFITMLLLAMLLPPQLSGAEEDDSSAPTAAYTLGAGDEIVVKVYGEQDLSMGVILAQKGSFNYPFLGEIKAQGLTVAELEQLITTGLKGPYLRNPEVTVAIKEFRPFYLNGEVERPGGYPYRPGLTLEQAVSLAGGLTERASKRKIDVLRSAAGDKQELTLKLSEPVYPGDVITVRRSFF